MTPSQIAQLEELVRLDENGLMPCPEIVIESIGGQCPVQAEGTIDGKPFYFRARNAYWSIGIGGEDVVCSPEWYFDAPYFDEDDPAKIPVYDKQKSEGGVIVGEYTCYFHAGWMDQIAARSFIHTAAVLYANTRNLRPLLRALLDELKGKDNADT